MVIFTTRRGVALLLAILASAIVSIGAAVALNSCERAAKSERIKEYNFILAGYRSALSLFRRKYNRYPSHLEELIDNEDDIPFIRRLYRDPFSGLPFSTRRTLSGEIEDVYSESAAALSSEY